MTRNAARSQGRSLVVRGQTSSACSPARDRPRHTVPEERRPQAGGAAHDALVGSGSSSLIVSFQAPAVLSSTTPSRTSRSIASMTRSRGCGSAVPSSSLGCRSRNLSRPTQEWNAFGTSAGGSPREALACRERRDLAWEANISLGFQTEAAKAAPERDDRDDDSAAQDERRDEGEPGDDRVDARVHRATDSWAELPDLRPVGRGDELPASSLLTARWIPVTLASASVIASAAVGA